MYPITAVHTELAGEEILLAVQYSTERIADAEGLHWSESLAMTPGQARAVIHELEHRLRELERLSRSPS